MSILVTPEDLQKALNEATKLHFAHFNKLDWLPEWISSKPVLKDNLSAPPKPSKSGPTPLNCVTLLSDRINPLKSKYGDQLKHVEASRQVEDPKNPDTGAKLTKAPHPGADFSHVDSGIYTGDEPKKFKDAHQALKDLEKLAQKDGEMNGAIQAALKAMGRADELMGVDPKGMQRLKLIFEWTLCHVTTLYAEINTALTNPNPDQGRDEYNAARARYIALLQDLDDGEPETKGDPESGKRGYGRAIKWSYILPLIHDGKIKGAKIIAKWNPHISSSGIAIPHL